jgi:membrane-bound serine protease (ClpP class)
MLFRPINPQLPQLPDMPQLSVSPWLVALMTLLWVGTFAFALRAAVRAQRMRVTSGGASLVGSVGLAQTDLEPRGIVLVRSEEWSAEAVEGSVRKGEKIEVVSVAEGLLLQVRKTPPA